MSYHNNIEDVPMKTLTKDVCFICGKPFLKNQPVIAYDGCHIDKDTIGTITMHGSCASAMGQRLVCDTWLSRNKWKNELLHFK